MIQHIDDDLFQWSDWLEVQLTEWPTETVQYKILREGLAGAAIRGLPCSCEPKYKMSSKSARIHSHVLEMSNKWQKVIVSRYLEREKPYKAANLFNMSRRKYFQVLDSIHKELATNI